jgi:hypothetical protein
MAPWEAKPAGSNSWPCGYCGGGSVLLDSEQLPTTSLKNRLTLPIGAKPGEKLKPEKSSLWDMIQVACGKREKMRLHRLQGYIWYNYPKIY